MTLLERVRSRQLDGNAAVGFIATPVNFEQYNVLENNGSAAHQAMRFSRSGVP